MSKNKNTATIDDDKITEDFDNLEEFDVFCPQCNCDIDDINKEKHAIVIVLLFMHLAPI